MAMGRFKVLILSILGDLCKTLPFLLQVRSVKDDALFADLRFPCNLTRFAVRLLCQEAAIRLYIRCPSASHACNCVRHDFLAKPLLCQDELALWQAPSLF